MTFADLDLARRLEACEVACVIGYALARRRLRPEADTAAVEVGSGCAFFFGEGSPLNEAKGLGMDGPVSDSDIDALERVFFDRGVAARVMVCPIADASLLDVLSRRGYRPSAFENVLYRPLDRAERFPEAPSEFSIGLAGPGEAELWGATLARGFSAPGEPDAESFELFRMSASLSGMRNFLARIDGEAAGAASLWIDDDLAMLCGASTLPGSRKRGVQTALTHARLALAASAGCELATISGLPGSTTQRNAERLGFRVAYTKTLLVREPG